MDDVTARLLASVNTHPRIRFRAAVDLPSGLDASDPIEFGHSLDDQIGGQLEAGFVLTGFFEDYDREHPLAKHIASFIATRAVRPTSA